MKDNQDPSQPQAPEAPETSENPENLETPENSEESRVSETSKAPETAKTPENPEESKTPETSEAVEVSEVTKNSEQPQSLKPSKKPKSKKKKAAIFACLLCLVAAGAATAYFLTRHAEVANDDQPATTAPLAPNALRLVGNSLSDFDLAFLKLDEKNENNIYSPLSIKYALAMLQEGADGSSKAQIDSLIGDYKPTAYLNNENRSLANVLFIKDTFSDKILPDYVSTLKSEYNASVIYDPITSATNINKWVSDETLGIIDNLLDDESVKNNNFVLVNALAIDMKWNNQLQCDINNNENGTIPCLKYSVRYAHEKDQADNDEVTYSASVNDIVDSGYARTTFNGNAATKSVEIGASFNRYDIIKEVGEEKIRSTITDAHKAWLKTEDAEYADADEKDTDKVIEEYMKELKSNYGQSATSTDFMLYDGDGEKVFAKNLREYDGSTLQYVAIMPKSGSLNDYLDSLTADKTTELIDSLKEVKIDNFKDGVITKITGTLPIFKFDHELDLKESLEAVGVTDVFDEDNADLSRMTDAEKVYIMSGTHKADIDFSNNGIRAAATTALNGGMGGGGNEFEYLWDVPVETIDITFDNPYLFLIRDKATGEVWFAGTVYSGTECAASEDIQGHCKQ